MILVANVLLLPQPGKPRASGDDPDATANALSTAAVNPARAGMILLGGELALTGGRKPRASGDDPAYPAIKAVVDG